MVGFRDLGYAPINQVSTAGPIAPVELDAEDEVDCGPVGPPDPEYVPGSVVINRELVEDEREDEREVDGPRNGEDSERYVRRYRGDEASDEEDDSDDSTSGIFARLKSAARKYGPPCGAV